MATRIQLRRGTSAQWTAANPILASGEIGIELDTFQWKVGDGTTAWASRPYVASGTVTLPEGGDLDDVPDGILYKKIQAAFATAINGGTFDAASVLAAGIGGIAKAVAADALDAIAISGIHATYSDTLGPFPGFTTYIISNVADATNQLQLALKQSTSSPQIAIRVQVAGTWYNWIVFDNVQAALNAGAVKTALADADVFTILDSVATNVIKKTTWANIKAKILAAFGVETAALTLKAPPADADLVAIADSASTNATRKTTFTGIWTWIQSKIHGADDKSALVDADKFALVDTEASNVTKTSTWANIKAKMWAAVGTLLAASTAKTTLADADNLAISDSAASNATKRISWAHFKTAMATAWGALGALLTEKATPVDADSVAITDSEASNATKKLVFANLWAWIKTKITAITVKTTPIGADSVVITDSAATDVPKRSTLTSIAAMWGTLVAVLTNKATPIDADSMLISDSAAAGVSKSVTFANFWTWIQGKNHAAANKDAIVDADKLLIVDTENANVTKSTTWSNLKAKIWAALGGLINGGTSKSAFVDGDYFALMDSAASNATKKLAGTGITRRTKWPDGATAVFEEDLWGTGSDANWYGNNGTKSISTIPGSILFTVTSSVAPNLQKASIPTWAGKTVFFRYKASKAFNVYPASMGSGYAKMYSASSSYTIGEYLCPLGMTELMWILSNGVPGDTFEIEKIWVGDYSYAVGSLSEEAARVWSEAADAPGTPQVAIGAVISNGTNVTAGDWVDIFGKRYTWVDALTASPGVEGQVLIGTNAQDSLTNLQYAINYSISGTGTLNGTKYWASAAHPMVAVDTIVGGNTLNLFSGTTLSGGTKAARTGEFGNQITLTKSAASLTLSGATLTGGVSAGAAKMSWLVARGSQGLDAKTSLVAGDYLTLLDSVVGFLKKKILVSQFFAADGGTGAYTAVQGNDSRIATAPASWTPVPMFGGVADDGTYAVTVNKVIQIGKFSMYEARIAYSAKGTKTGAFSLGGHATPQMASSSVGGADVTFATGFTGLSTSFRPEAVIGANFITFRNWATSGWDVTSPITDANFTNTSDIRVRFSYIRA